VAARGIPRRALRLLHQLYRAGGREAIDPRWSESITSLQYLDALTLYERIASIADSFIPINQAVATIVKAIGWSVGRATRILKRYRVGGILGLTPQYSSDSRAKGRERSTEAFLDDED